ncbi:Alanine racemase 1 [Weissella viridescens]|uniref:Alanine racemase 1 n=1 Tax=Weissella viridescens TaxID=1629 RepID=A0A380P6W2_WEIVI|nr:Alanine racemase 1 [Weissella viridescens]
MQAANVDQFAVAVMDEGIWLRQFGVTEPVMVLGLTPVQYVAEIVDNQLTVPVSSVAWLKEALRLLPQGPNYMFPYLLTLVWDGLVFEIEKN